MNAPTTDEQYKMWRACGSKTAYATRAMADAARTALARKRKLVTIYRCPHGSHFHLASAERRRDREK